MIAAGNIEVGGPRPVELRHRPRVACGCSRGLRLLGTQLHALRPPASTVVIFDRETAAVLWHQRHGRLHGYVSLSAPCWVRSAGRRDGAEDLDHAWDRRRGDRARVRGSSPSAGWQSISGRADWRASSSGLCRAAAVHLVPQIELFRNLRRDGPGGSPSGPTDCSRQCSRGRSDMGSRAILLGGLSLPGGGRGGTGAARVACIGSPLSRSPMLWWYSG